MDRRKFLNRLGLGAVGAVVGTKVVIELAKKKSKTHHVFNVDKIKAQQKIVAGIDPFPVGDGWLKQIESRGSQSFTIYTDRRGHERFSKAIEKMNESYGKG